MEKYNITQHQTSIDIDLSKLSKEQIVIRAKEIEKEGEKKRCKRCLKEKLFSGFRLNTERRGVKGIYYDASCKDCHARTRGTKEIGKLSYAKALFDKGFRRCTTCKGTKPLTEYYGNRAAHSKISNTCKICSNEINCRKHQESKK